MSNLNVRVLRSMRFILVLGNTVGLNNSSKWMMRIMSNGGIPSIYNRHIKYFDNGDLVTVVLFP